MFGSDDMPLGPGGRYPKQRVSSFGNQLVPGQDQDVEEEYLGCGMAQLPAVERDYHSSVNRVKERMKTGKRMRMERDQDEQRDRPRYAMKKHRNRFMFGE